jgi:muconate cycloisomerase
MTTKIVDVDARIVDLPIRRRHRLGIAVMTTQSTVIVRVHTDDGLVGLGEAVVPGGGPQWGGESVETMKAVIDRYLTPALTAAPVEGVNDLRARLDRVSPHTRFARAALEMAAFDLQGKRLGASVVDLLGGAQRERLPVLWSVGGDTENAGDEIARRLADGHRTLKFMVAGESPEQDTRRIVDLLRDVPDDVMVIVDMNARWTELDVTWWVPRLVEAGVDVVEQPAPAWDRHTAAGLVARGAVTVMADESVQSPTEARDVIESRSAHAVAVKVPKSGGITRARETAAVARAGGLALYGGGTMETSIGTAAAAALYGTWGSALGCDLVGPLLLTEDVATEPITYDAGDLCVPTGPGLGVVLDEDKVNFYTRK